MNVRFALPGALVLAGAVFSAVPAAAATFSLDQGHADVVFAIDHAGLSKTYGRFNTVDGTIIMNDEAIETSSVEITIDAASLDTNHTKRDEHLRNADFFNVEAHPTLTFKSTAIEPTGDNTATMIGDLTMLGVTKPVTLDVTLNQRGPHPIPSYNGIEAAGFSASGTLSRSEWGMDNFVPIVGDTVEITIEIEAFREDADS